MKKQIYDRSPFDSLIATAKRQGYSKGMVAEAIGCSRGTLSQWITGKRTPTVIYRMRFPIVEGRFQRKKGPKYKENDDDSNGFDPEVTDTPTESNEETTTEIPYICTNRPSINLNYGD